MLFSQPWLGASVGSWLAFLALVITLLVIDLGLLNRRNHVVSVPESLKLSAFYIGLALLFGLWVGYAKGSQAATEYYTGYLIEKSLSLDNLFIIAMIFNYFAISRQFQHRILFWGILGVIILRGLLIGVGSVLVAKFAWILYIFAVFLIIMGIKLLRKSPDKDDLSQNKLLLFFKKYTRITPILYGANFWQKLPHPKYPSRLVWWMTPLFLALLLIELSDLIFALDSIPAIFAITTDTYIVYTSNIFAILGLRALYFALADLMHRFHYLNYALAGILIFIGTKVLLVPLTGWHISPMLSLITTLLLLSGGVIASLYRPSKK